LLVYDKEAKANVLLSAGVASSGMLAQGEPENNSDTFKELKYDKTKIEFVDMSSYQYTAFAIDSKGKLYSWGNNNQHNILQPERGTRYYQPTLVPYFADDRWKVIKVVGGQLHVLI